MAGDFNLKTFGYEFEVNAKLCPFMSTPVFNQSSRENRILVIFCCEENCSLWNKELKCCGARL